MTDLFGIPITHLRISTAVGMITSVALFVYEVSRFVDCMKHDQDSFKGSYDKLIWAAMIIYLPLGIGGWAYDRVVNHKGCDPKFGIPFTLAIVSIGYTMIKVLPLSTNFNLDFLKI